MSPWPSVKELVEGRTRLRSVKHFTVTCHECTRWFTCHPADICEFTNPTGRIAGTGKWGSDVWGRSDRVRKQQVYGTATDRRASDCRAPCAFVQRGCGVQDVFGWTIECKPVLAFIRQRTNCLFCIADTEICGLCPRCAAEKWSEYYVYTNHAACIVQRMARGWLVRRHYATCACCNFPKQPHELTSTGVFEHWKDAAELICEPCLDRLIANTEYSDEFSDDDPFPVGGRESDPDAESDWETDGDGGDIDGELMCPSQGGATL